MDGLGDGEGVADVMGATEAVGAGCMTRALDEGEKEALVVSGMTGAFVEGEKEALVGMTRAHKEREREGLETPPQTSPPPLEPPPPPKTAYADEPRKRKKMHTPRPMPRARRAASATMLHTERRGAVLGASHVHWGGGAVEIRIAEGLV
jgi:hypothetical protein